MPAASEARSAGLSPEWVLTGVLGAAGARPGVNATSPSTSAPTVAMLRRIRNPPSARPQPPPRTARATLLKAMVNI